MKAIVQKMWITEGKIEIPDGLSEMEIKDWLENNAEAVANNSSTAQWDSTFVMNAETDEEIHSW